MKRDVRDIRMIFLLFLVEYCNHPEHFIIFFLLTLVASTLESDFNLAIKHRSLEFWQNLTQGFSFNVDTPASVDTVHAGNHGIGIAF